jgi:hypothetical protein
VYGNAGLARDIVQQPPVRSGEILPRGARGQDQLSYLPRLVGERQGDRLARRGPVLSHCHESTSPVQADGGVGQFERLGDRLHDGLERRIGGERGLQPLSETREYPIRLVALSVHQVVDAALHPAAQGREE